MAALDFAPILAALAKEGRGFSVWLQSAARIERVVDVEPDGSILVWFLDEYSVPVMLVGSATITPCGLAQDPGGALRLLEAELHQALLEVVGLSPASAPSGREAA